MADCPAIHQVCFYRIETVAFYEGHAIVILIGKAGYGIRMQSLVLPRSSVLLEGDQFVQGVGYPGAVACRDPAHVDLGQEVRAVLTVFTVDPIAIGIPG